MAETTREMLDWLKNNAPEIWWHTVEARIGMSDEDYAEYVAGRFREARTAPDIREKL